MVTLDIYWCSTTQRRGRKYTVTYQEVQDESQQEAGNQGVY